MFSTVSLFPVHSLVLLNTEGHQRSSKWNKHFSMSLYESLIYIFGSDSPLLTEKGERQREMWLISSFHQNVSLSLTTYISRSSCYKITTPYVCVVCHHQQSAFPFIILSYPPTNWQGGWHPLSFFYNEESQAHWG